MSDNRREALEALRDKVKAGNGQPPFSEAFGGYGVISRAANGAYHGSLDAAKALHDAVLPGWNWAIEDDDQAEVFNMPDKDERGHWTPGHSYLSGMIDSSNPARMWLLAILSALISETPKGETP